MARPYHLFAVLLVALGGCGQDGEYKIAPVSGRVTLNGEPLAEARVLFEPTKASETRGKGKIVGTGSSGSTDSSGRFSLTTNDGRRGAVVGSHRVTISTFKMKDNVGEVFQPSDVIAQEKVPTKYNVEGGLGFEVPPDGSSAANFELTGPPPPLPKPDPYSKPFQTPGKSESTKTAPAKAEP